ncbi:MAG: hypothetical protein F8N37_13985 [Telmatospirillum sp.]|nr:hypothetical protein [Telmatospirillum sp.]
MTTETLPKRPETWFRWALILSALLHAALLVLFLNRDWLFGPPPQIQPEPLVVDLVPSPVRPQPRPKPPEQKPAEQKPPEQKPPEQKPPEQKPSQPRPPERMAATAPLTRPQLQPGRIAERSSVPHPADRNGAAGTSLALALPAAPGGTAPSKAGKPGISGPEGPALTQSEQDFILAQIMKYWRVDFHAPEARGLTLSGVFFVQADGTLASPVNKDDPWNPEAIVADYGALSRYRREAVDGFLLAMRLAQPLELPSKTGPWPRRITINFAFDAL